MTNGRGGEAAKGFGCGVDDDGWELIPGEGMTDTWEGGDVKGFGCGIDDDGWGLIPGEGMTDARGEFGCGVDDLC